MPHVLWLLGFASLYQSCGAIPWMGAMETPNSLLATAGISPRPTQAPGLHGIPKELKPRANYQYPPPDSWCGFVDGDYCKARDCVAYWRLTDGIRIANVLSCASQDTCYASSTVAGCCSDTARCDSIGIATSCAGFDDDCDASCLEDPLVLRWYVSLYNFFKLIHIDQGCASNNPRSVPIQT